MNFFEWLFPASQKAVRKKSAEVFEVELTDAGSKKIGVIKAVRELTGLGLKEAREVVESAPCPVAQGLEKAEAEHMRKALFKAGAQAAVKITGKRAGVFEVELTDAGSKKIGVIKAVRELTGLGLKEARELVESAPCPVAQGLEKAEAEHMRDVFFKAGAQAAVKKSEKS